MYGLLLTHWHSVLAGLKVIHQHQASARITKQASEQALGSSVFSLLRSEAQRRQPSPWSLHPSLTFHGSCTRSQYTDFKEKKGPSFITSAHKSGFVQVAGLFSVQRKNKFFLHTLLSHISHPYLTPAPFCCYPVEG